LIRVVPGRAGAALTKPGCASTARWCRSGERDGEEYARNRRLTSLNPSPARTWRIWAGRGAHPPLGGELRGWFDPAARGGHGGKSAAYSWRCRRDTVGLLLRRANHSEHGNRPDLACRRAASVGGGLGAPTADRSGTGRSRRSSPMPGEPVTWRRAAAVVEKMRSCNAERRTVEWRCLRLGPYGDVVAGIGDAGQASPLGGG
jgi:hypothetical protein